MYKEFSKVKDDLNFQVNCCMLTMLFNGLSMLEDKEEDEEEHEDEHEYVRNILDKLSLPYLNFH